MLPVILGLLLQVVPAGADPNTPAPPATSQRTEGNRLLELQKKALRLAEAAKKLGNWGEQAELSRTAIEKVFQRAGWDTPEDLFAFEMFRAVDSRPPWAYMERADTFFSLLSKRYRLDDDQRSQLVDLVVREATGLFAEHADTILAYSTEMIEARAAGQPFTADQIARWTKMSEPVLVDGHRRMQEATAEFMEDLSPEQREIVAADLRAADRRVGTVQEMMQEWKEGRWEAADWGMEEDPIQTGKVAAEREGRPQPGSETQPDAGDSAGTAPVPKPPAEPPATSRPEIEPEPAQPPAPDRVATKTPAPRRAVDADPWAKYVQAFIDKYKLEETQGQKAWVYYDQSKERVGQVTERWGPAVAGKAGEKKSDATRLKSELERVFAQLKLRLERLPTRVQRRDATPGEIPSPIASASASVPTSQPKKQ
jgi:hypothetical protein